MSYQLSSKKRQARKNMGIKAILIVFGVAFVTIAFSVLSNPFTDSTDQALEIGSGGVSFFTALLSNKDKLIAENERLQQELDEQTLDRQQQSQLVERNQELLRLLGRDSSAEYVLAGVVKKPPFNPYDIYTLDAGSEEGVRVGDLVSFSDYVALGAINSVTEAGSKALLFSAANNSTEVSINGDSFTAVGKGGGVMQVSAARDAGVEPGDSLILPGYKLVSIGIVQEVLADPQDGFSRVMVTTPMNVQAVELVRIEEYRGFGELTVESNDS